MIDAERNELYYEIEKKNHESSYSHDLYCDVVNKIVGTSLVLIQSPLTFEQFKNIHDKYLFEDIIRNLIILNNYIENNPEKLDEYGLLYYVLLGFLKRDPHGFTKDEMSWHVHKKNNYTRNYKWYKRIFRNLKEEKKGNEYIFNYRKLIKFIARELEIVSSASTTLELFEYEELTKYFSIDSIVDGVIELNKMEFLILSKQRLYDKIWESDELVQL